MTGVAASTCLKTSMRGVACLVALSAFTDVPAHAVTLPVGIYLLDMPPGPELDQAVASGHYDGLTIQVRWSELEPQARRYDWSTLDQPVRAALSRGKKLAIGIQAGQWSPSWLFESPYRVAYDHVAFSWGGGNKCTQADIPRPWDTRLVSTMLETWTDIARHLAAIRGATDAVTMVKVNGFNLANDQLRALAAPPRNAFRSGCAATDGVELYRQAGFRPRAVVENWKTLARGVAALFPTSAIAIDVIPGPGAFPAIDDNGMVFDARSGGGPNLTADIVAAAVGMFPGRVYAQPNTLDMGPNPEDVGTYLASGARLGLQTNAHARGGASCGPRRDVIPCTPDGYAALLDHGISFGAWFIEVHAKDGAQFGAVIDQASAKIRALHGMR